jgi:1,4-dihydroxy-2-naphthoate octaprenyltransferase
MAATTSDLPWSPFKIWLTATRPKTLPAAAAPVLVGWAVALKTGGFAPGPALAALAGALLLQIAANFANDYFDFKKGADTAERLGPLRVTQAGLVTPQEIQRATALVIALAVLVGLYLASVGGWPIVVLGLAAIATALAYTGGPFPLGYNGLGEVAVFAFFGPAAVVGTAYVQTHAPGNLALWLSIGPGALSAAILGVNNLRDRPTDVQCGKRTLAVRFGAGFARALYVALVASAFVIPAGLVATGQLGYGALLCLLALPLAVPPTRLVFTAEGAALNAGLAGTAKLLMVYGVLLAIGVAV